MTGRRWLLLGLGVGVAVILAANAHLLYVALESAPGCAADGHLVGKDGEVQVLQAAKGAC